MGVKRREPDKKKDPKRAGEPAMKDWTALVLRSRESPSLAPRGARTAPIHRGEAPAGD